MQDPAHFEGPAGSIACDARHFPLVFMRFQGHVDVDLVTRYDAWQNQHVEALERSDQQVAWIADVRRVELPTPDVRRFLAQKWRSNVARYRSRVIIEYAVVDSAVIRGLFTLFRMISPSMQVDTFASLDAAARRARVVLGDARIASSELTAAQIDQLFRG